MRTPPRIVLAPDKFKGSLPAARIVSIMRDAVLAELPSASIVAAPMADGGDGTVEAFVGSGARREIRTVAGPLGRPVDAAFAMRGRTAIIEMAAASGLALLRDEERSARTASTRGTGELILAALDAGAEQIVVGLGGSATNDGGAGLLTALGARLLDRAGRRLPEGGAALDQLASIDLAGLDPRLKTVSVEAACDVENPLCGEEGASAVFGPQKGATPQDVADLDRALARFADISAAVTGRDLRALPGAGAAGGLGFALATFMNATVRSGTEIVAEIYDLDSALSEATLCLSAEGRVDEQTPYGKTIAGVARIARRHGVPVIAFCGSVERGAEEALYELGIVTVPIVEGPMTLSEAIGDAEPLLAAAVRRALRLLLIS